MAATVGAGGLIALTVGSVSGAQQKLTFGDRCFRSCPSRPLSGESTKSSVGWPPFQTFSAQVLELRCDNLGNSRRKNGMKYMITWNERPQGSAIEYEKA